MQRGEGRYRMQDSDGAVSRWFAACCRHGHSVNNGSRQVATTAQPSPSKKQKKETSKKTTTKKQNSKTRVHRKAAT